MMSSQLLRMVGVVVLLVVASTAWADWPAYRGDNGRRGYAEADIALPLGLAWVNQSAPPPSPAWPAPARGSLWQNLSHIEARVTDDIAYQPVIAGGCVLFGSSADDHLYCLDAETGAVRWSFAADAPIRYAPAVAEGRVYFGCDDGLVRCVGLDDGGLVWARRIGPEADRIPGNGRFISPWPVRTGLVVEGGVVYACAGLFPSQGTYAVALQAVDGEPVWQTPLPELSPQGYLLASVDKLYVPTGRANPFEIARATGAIGKTFGSPGGTYAILSDDSLIVGPGNDNTLQANSPTDAQQLIRYQGRHMAVGPKISYFLTGEKLFALDRKRYTELSAQAAGLRAELAALKGDERAGEQAVAIQRKLDETERAAAACVLWEVATEDRGALIATGELVLVGGQDRVQAYRAEDGRPVSRVRTDGAVMALAVDDQTLIATTERGAVYAFRSGGRPSAHTAIKHESPKPAPLDAAATRWLDEAIRSLPSPRGYAVILGDPPAGAVEHLIQKSGLNVLVVTAQASSIQPLREALLGAGHYGNRATVHHSADSHIPVADYTINLVLDWGAFQGNPAWSEQEARRVLAPGRGVAWTGQDASYRRPPLENIGSWTHQYANPANTSNSGEANLTGNIALQWFGGPGPSRMIDRHLRGPPPLAFDGKLVMVAENKLIGVDAYNGTELWELDMPQSQRYAMPYDAGYIAAADGKVLAAVDHEVWVIDPETGRQTGRVPLPRGVDPKEFHWGYVGLVDNALIGSVIRPTAPITEPHRSITDLSYRSAYPLATSVGLFKYEPGFRRLAWTYGNGVIVNGTITAQSGRIYFIESRSPKAKADTTGRITVPDLLSADAFVVALDATTGQQLWEQPVALPNAKNILYLVATETGKIVLATSVDADQATAHYYLRVLDADDGAELWKTDHRHVKSGLYHGEQVHHPVILGDRLVAEPLIYDLNTGQQINPDGDQAPWQIRRPGHSCGTMSGAGDYLFFRANNPTMLDMTDRVRGEARFTRLAPSRAGCWINVLPAQGLILIPEASASCVCSYSLQTSMAFRPIPRKE